MTEPHFPIMESEEVRRILGALCHAEQPVRVLLECEGYLEGSMRSLDGDTLLLAARPEGSEHCCVTPPEARMACVTYTAGSRTVMFMTEAAGEDPEVEAPDTLTLRCPARLDLADETSLRRIPVPVDLGLVVKIDDGSPTKCLALPVDLSMGGIGLRVLGENMPREGAELVRLQLVHQGTCLDLDAKILHRASRRFGMTFIGTRSAESEALLRGLVTETEHAWLKAVFSAKQK